MTAAGVQSADGKGAYVILNLAGEQGTTLSNESVEAVREVVARTPAPPGVKAYVTGSTAHSSDEYMIGNASMNKITLFTLAAIAIMLFLVYRSIAATLIQLFMTLIELAVSRGVIAVLGNYGLIELAVFATALLTMLGIAAGTDYGIFLIGRYREARAAGEDRETAYYTTFHGVTPVVLGSGLTIAGATFCLVFTRLPWFTTMGSRLQSACSSWSPPRSPWVRPFSWSRPGSACWNPRHRVAVDCGGGSVPPLCVGRHRFWP